MQLRAVATIAAGLVLLWASPGGAQPATLDTQMMDKGELQQLIQAAPQLETEDLCEPVKSVRQGMLLRAPNPDGKTWDLLQVYFPSYGGPNTIVVVDLGSGQVKNIQTDRGWNFHLCPTVIAPDGRLFISILDRRLRQKLCIYDPATNELTIDAVAMPEEILGETHPLVLGTDAMIYAIGQHPDRSATAAQIDPDTLEVTAYGPIGPSHAPNACWGYSGGADDRHIYIASGKIPWYLVAYDRETGESATLVETEPVGGYVSVKQGPDGCTATATRVLDTDGERLEYWLHEGKAIPIRDRAKDKPPWVADSSAPDLPPVPQINTGLAVPDVEGFAELWVRTEEGKARAPQDPPPSAKPEDLGWRRFRYQVPLYPHSIYRLQELPDGRLLGTAGAYEGNFIYDPVKGEGKHLGKIGLSHYATALSGGKIYMSGYPTSPLYEYDPNEPWTAGVFDGSKAIPDDAETANPRRLMYMGVQELAGTHKMYAAAVDNAGKVYFGGRWIRNGACGGLAWYDPNTEQAGGLWRPLSNYQVTHMAAANDGRTIVVSTRRVEDSVLGKPKPEQGALFFLDTATDELTGKLEPVTGVKGTGPIAAVGGGRVMGWTSSPDNPQASILYVVDVEGPRVVHRKSLPCPLPVAIGSNQQEAWDFRIGPDGMVWTFMGGAMVRIDPAGATVHALGRLSTPGRIAFSKGKVFLGGTTFVRQVKGLAVPEDTRARE